MIELKPHLENNFICPECDSKLPTINNVLVQPIHVLADCTCDHCNLNFYQTFPVSHNVDYPLSVNINTGRVYENPDTPEWLYDSFKKAYSERKKSEVVITRKIFQEVNDIIVLNTLDYLYGHVLLKLYNALYHLDHQPNIGLVVIVPKMFEWLIPKGCAEAWIMDLKLGQLNCWYDAIHEFATNEFKRFNKIYLSNAYSHPEFSTMDISRLTGIKPFSLSNFKKTKPVITFILREDRWWFTNTFDYVFYRVCRKLKFLSWGSKVLSKRQNRLVKETIMIIKKRLPEVELYIVGLGKTGSFDHATIDERKTITNDFIEADWCRVYAKSHIVIGIHGSNMLLPTALAAGCVEILPHDRYGNMIQDISVRYNDRKQLFLYRFAEQYATPAIVAGKVAAMITDYSMYDKNMCRNHYLVHTNSADLFMQA